MPYISLHKTGGTRATVVHHRATPTHGAFAVLSIITDDTTLALHVPADRAAWAKQVAAAINAPVAASVERAA